MVDDDGRTPDHGHPISLPCEPNGSGELKIHCYFLLIKCEKLRIFCIAKDFHILSTKNKCICNIHV